MIPQFICRSVLSVGCNYLHPRGGIAQVMNSYSQSIFYPFRCIVNSGGSNKLVKFWRALSAYVATVCLLLFDSRIKIIHIHTASNVSFRRSALWVSLARCFHKKSILHIHGGGFKAYYQTNPSWIHAVLEQCDCIVALNDVWKSYFVDELHCKNVCVIKNPVPDPILVPEQRHDSRFHLLFLGLITEEKGIFDFLEMLAVHRMELADRVMLHIGGDGKVEELQKKIEEWNLGTFVRYEGFVSGVHKSMLFNRSDALILPSYTEGLPISILEAMTYSMPVLTTPVGGIPEVVHNGVNGLLFQPGDKDAMFQALKLLLDTPQMHKLMGRESKKMVQGYLPHDIEGDLLKLYMQLIDRK